MKKSQIVVGIIYMLILIISVILFIIVKNNEKNNQNIDAYFILDNQTNYIYSINDGFSIISDEEIESLKLLFKTYSDGNYIGDYYLTKVNLWNLFDKNNNYISYDGYLFAYSSNLKISIDASKSRTMNNLEMNLLKKHFKISSFNHLYTNEVYEVDLNNDGIVDKIICASNNSIETSNSENYNLIVSIIDNQVKAIVEEYNVSSTNVYSIKGFFNINNSAYKYVIVEKIMNYDGDVESYSVNDKIYKYYNNNYKEVKTTKR